MNLTQKIVAATTVIGFLVITAGASQATEVASSAHMIKPMTGQGSARADLPFLLNLIVGPKQAVAYYENDHGRCNLAVFAADAFDGENVPKLSTVRFDASIEGGKTAQFYTSENKSLEFTCQADALAMSIQPSDQLADATSTK